METKWLQVQVKKVDAGARTVEGMASTSSPDYGGDVVLSSAWKESLRAWKKMGSQPKFLAYHMHATEGGHSPVIGKFLEIKILPDGLWFKAEFAETPLGEEHLYLYQGKFMDAFSVGFMSKESEQDPEKIAKILKKNSIEAAEGAVDRVVTKAHLLEVSCVVVGMNMQALTTASAEPMAVKALDRLEQMGMGATVTTVNTENDNVAVCWVWDDGIIRSGYLAVDGPGTADTFDFSGSEDVTELGPPATEPEYSDDPLDTPALIDIKDAKDGEMHIEVTVKPDAMVLALADVVEVIKGLGVMVSECKAEVASLREENKALHSGPVAVKDSAPAEAPGMTAAQHILTGLGDMKQDLGKIRKQYGLDT